MSHETVLHVLAITLLICVGIVTAIDLAVEIGFKQGIRLKWTYLWYLTRYTAIICGILLALDTLTK